MKEQLKEIILNDNYLCLNGNMVKGGVLPGKIAELKRTVTIQGDSIIDGAVYVSKFTIENGDAEIKGATFAQHELHINTDATGSIIFRKAVASAGTVTSRANGADVTFCSDINAKEVNLTNAFVAGSIYADEINLDNCVVVGGVFATIKANIKNSIVGTFNAPNVSCDGIVQLFLPTAFSQNDMSASADPNTKLYNLSLADLGGLFRGNEQSPESGRIEMNIKADEVKSELKDDDEDNPTSKKLYSYTVVGKVLAADMVDYDKFQNHFLLTAAALGPQLLSTYDLGVGSNGESIQLTVENIREFLFKVLRGQIEIQPLAGSFNMGELVRE